MSEKPVILIVDDVSSNVQLVANVLKEDYDLKVATSGERALQLAKLDPIPDLILLDVKMPEMDGHEVFKKLKQNPSTQDIPVIFVTGSDTVEDEKKGFLLGAVDYITKPIHPAIVQARVKTHIIIKKQRDQLIYSASHDQLTGLNNRHILNEEGLRKFSRAHRQDDKLCIIILDIDFFKKVNDTYGHLAGDNILKAVANVLKINKRDEDLIVRFGGEEFIIILESCSVKDAKIKAESIRQQIENLDTDGIKITMSFGIAEISKKYKTFESLLKDADEALFRAKDNGRNRVEIF